MEASTENGPSSLPTARRALIVEDEGLNILFLMRALRKKGYQVLGKATSGEQAIEQVCLLKPDFVLMDINLAGGMSGLEATRRIMAECPVPIIVLTAYSQEQFQEEARHAGAVGYIVKPVTAERLDSEIERALHCSDN